MLKQVLLEMQAAQGTVRLSELAARLNVEPGALKGMLAFWAGKGRMAPVSIDGDIASCATACKGSCPGVAQCPFVAKMPKMWERKSGGPR